MLALSSTEPSSYTFAKAIYLAAFAAWPKGWRGLFTVHDVAELYVEGLGFGAAHPASWVCVCEMDRTVLPVPRTFGVRLVGRLPACCSDYGVLMLP